MGPMVQFVNETPHLTDLRFVFFETPLGKMLVVGDERAIFLAEFESFNGESAINEVVFSSPEGKVGVPPGKTLAIELFKTELNDYFAGSLREFSTPVFSSGTTFQKEVWRTLLAIPYGQVRSYRDQAEAIGNRKAYRAVANANAANKLAIIVPCHRIINSDGRLGGYGGGCDRKQWLLEHEKKHFSM